MLKAETVAFIECDNSHKEAKYNCERYDKTANTNKSRCVDAFRQLGWRVMKNYTLCPHCSGLERKYIEVRNGN